MRRLFYILAIPLLSACVATMPQTSKEYKEVATKYPKWYLAEKAYVPRSHDQVAASIFNKWNECYALSQTTRRTSGGMTTMNYSDTYTPKIKRINNSQIELVLQQETKGMVMLDKTPPGGYYILVLDVIKKSNGGTELHWYSTSDWKEEWARNKEWAVGKNVACKI